MDELGNSRAGCYSRTKPVATGNRAMWRASIDHETYARVDGTWMFHHKRGEPLMNVPFETGWAEARFP
jgi:hypothetical protein